jgi:cytochrome P450
LTLSNDYTLKKDDTLFYPLFLIHRNPLIWFEPERFNPNRFDDEIVPYSYCPFGFGPRICPGEMLAQMEIRLLIVLIMQKFDFELDMDVSDVVPEERFVTMAKNDVKIKLINRFD